MRRLFWIGVGASVAVVAYRRATQIAHRYTPAGVAEQVDQARATTTGALREAVGRFGAARAERERDLVATLLVTPDGGDASTVLRRGRHADELARAAEPARAAGSARPSGRVDDDDPLYDF